MTIHPTGSGQEAFPLDLLATQSPSDGIRDAFRIQPHRRPRIRQVQNDLSLPAACNCSVAVESGEHVLVPEVLAPRLERFWRLAQGLPEVHQRGAKAVGVEVWQAGLDERLAEDGSYRPGAAPVLALGRSATCAPMISPPPSGCGTINSRTATTSRDDTFASPRCIVTGMSFKNPGMSNRLIEEFTPLPNREGLKCVNVFDAIRWESRVLFANVDDAGQPSSSMLHALAWIGKSSRAISSRRSSV